MKKKSGALFANVCAAMAVFVLSACGPEPELEKSDAAVITAISLGAFAVDEVPLPISGADWTAAADGDLISFGAEYTGKITMDQDSDINGNLNVTASAGAAKEYALGLGDQFKPAGAFAGTVPALDKAKPLFIKVTSENRKTVNFYRVRIQTRILPVEARIPAITTHPVSGFYDPPLPADGRPNPLTVEAESPDGGVISYQWYSNDTNTYTNGTAIEGQTGTSFQPPAPGNGVKKYYWAAVTNTNNQVTGGDTDKSKTVTSRIALIVMFGAPAIEMITSGGSSSPVFRFALPEGETWSDYKTLTYKVMIADQASWDQTGIRAYVTGTYGDSNFQNGKYAQGNWGSHRLVVMELSPLSKLLSSTDNTAVTAGADGPMKWATFEHDVTTWSTGFHVPAATHPGPFYFAFGPTINQNTNAAGRIKYYIKDIFLVKTDGDTKIQADKFLNYRVHYGTDVVEQEAVAEPQEQQD